MKIEDLAKESGSVNEKSLGPGLGATRRRRNGGRMRGEEAANRRTDARRGRGEPRRGKEAVERQTEAR